MKTCRLKKTFSGNQTGYGETETLAEGAVATLSDPLAEIALKEGWAEPESPIPVITATARGVLTPEAIEARETKVTAPAETKPAAPAAKKGKK